MCDSSGVKRGKNQEVMPQNVFLKHAENYVAQSYETSCWKSCQIFLETIFRYSFNNKLDKEKN